MDRFFSVVRYALLLPLLFFFSLSSFSRDGRGGIEVLSYHPDGMVMEFSLPDYQLASHDHFAGDFFRIHIKGFYPFMDPGAPDLPLLRRLVSVPAGSSFQVIVHHSDYQTLLLDSDFPGQLLFPAQPSAIKTGEPPEFALDSTIYQEDQYFGKDAVSMEHLGIARDQALARLTLSPFQYNAVTNSLRVLRSATIEIKYTDTDHQKESHLRQKGRSHFFNPAATGLLQGSPAVRDSISTVPGKYVIVSDTLFQSSLQPFVRWKTQKGFQVVEAYLSDPQVGNTPSSIRSYLKDLYDQATPSDPAPVYVLLAGDPELVPTFQGQNGSHPTDMYYGEYTNDFIPDAYVGRFSATDTAELNAQIRKTLTYERYELHDPSYLNNAVLIAGHDGTYAATHGNGQVNYIESEYMNPSTGFQTHSYLHPASSSQKYQVIQSLSDGFTIANYTAHGRSFGWENPQLFISDLSNLQNTGKYGLMIGNACLTNQFSLPLSFGEAVMRLENRGATGYIGGSNNTYWDEDFYWAVGVTSLITSFPYFQGTSEGAYDLLFHTHNQPFERWYTTQAQIMFSGNLAVTQSGSNRIPYYWEVYNLMGDPSLMPYLGEPSPVPASYIPVLPVGLAQKEVITHPYATVALSKNDSLIAAVQADGNGQATLQFAPFTQTGSLLLVITAQNKQPLIDTISIINPSGPYIISQGYSINDSLGNNNQKADYGEKLYLHQELRNFTMNAASHLTATLSSQDTNITILDSLHVWDTIPPNSSREEKNAFVVQVKDHVPDKHNVQFDLTITDTMGGAWVSHFIMPLHAPLINFRWATLEELQGNGNGIPEPGETARLTATLANYGSADARNLSSIIMALSPKISISGTSNKSHGDLQAGSMTTISYDLYLDDLMWYGDTFSLQMTAETGAYKAIKKYGFMAGQAMEDFESGDFSQFHWEHPGFFDWHISSNNPLAGSFSAKSTDNLNHNQESVLAITMDVIKEDTLSFLYKVSSEEDFDFLEFWKNNRLLGKWSGIHDQWEKAAFLIPEGTHTFTWKYVKDYSVSHGEDCAWIDNIIFPPSDIYAAAGSQQKNDASLTVFPNPAREQVNIRATDQMKHIRLKDLSGRLVWQETLNGKQNSYIQTGHLSRGVYILSVSWANNKVPVHQKVILK